MVRNLYSRYNLYNSLSLMLLRFRISNGELMNRIEPMLDKLPSDYSYEWTGIEVWKEKVSGNQRSSY